MKCLKQASCTVEQEASSHNRINTLHDSSNKTVIGLVTEAKQLNTALMAKC